MTQEPGSPGGTATGGAAAPAEAARYYEQSTRLVLWRHGQTPWNVQGRFQGRLAVFDEDSHRHAFELIGQHGLEHQFQFAPRTRDDLKDLGSRGLLF